MDDKKLVHWRDLMAPLKSSRIEPPEPQHRAPSPSPGWIAFAYRLGIEPRCASALFSWKARMVPVSRIQRRRELVEDFMSLREQFEPPVPQEARDGYGAPPSDPASRLLSVPRRGAGMLGFYPKDSQ